MKITAKRRKKETKTKEENMTQNKNLTSEEDEACVKAMLLSSSHVFPMVLNAAIELDIFEIIARAGPSGVHISPSTIATQLPANKNSDAASLLDRMLRLLASHSLLSCKISASEDGKAERHYGLAPAAKFFVKDNDGGSLAAASPYHCHPVVRDVWLHLKDAVLEGGDLFKKIHGMPFFLYLDNDPSLNKAFCRAMSGISTMIMKKVLDVYEGFEGLKTLVDVGGGIGASLNMIVSKHPSIKGINFDLPHVVEHAPFYPGIEHVGGDMFKSVPQGDAIMIKTTCHDWSDEHCVKILKNCYNALPGNGKVIVIDFLMPEAPETSDAAKFVSQLDNAMLLEVGGRERTQKEFEALSKASGFSKFQVMSCAYIFYVMELYK